MQRAVLLGGLIAIVSTSGIAAITASDPIDFGTELVFKNAATRDVAHRLVAAFTAPAAKRVTSLCSGIMTGGPEKSGARAHAMDTHTRLNRLKWEIRRRIQELKLVDAELAVRLTNNGADMLSLMEMFVTNAHLECTY